MYNGLTLADRYELFEYDKKRTHLITKLRVKEFYVLFDRLLMYNPDLKFILRYVEDEVSLRWMKSIRGYVLNLARVSYMHYLMMPQQYNYQGNLVFKYNYIIIQQYLQRTVSVLIHNYNLPNKHYAFSIKTIHLNRLSNLFADKLYIDSCKMVKHYYKLYPTTTPTTHAQKIIDGKNTLLDKLYS